MTLVRRVALLVVAVLALTACGSSSNSNSSGPSAQTQIRSAYQKFFAPKTPLSERVALLQNGSRFKPVIKGFASNPLAKNASATVSSVTLQGANKAKVVYSVRLGSTSLGKQRGTAVRQNGTWKVGYASLCRLVALGGGTPSACRP